MALDLGKAVMLMQRPKLAEPGCGSEPSLSVGPASCSEHSWAFSCSRNVWDRTGLAMGRVRPEKAGGWSPGTHTVVDR